MNKKSRARLNYTDMSIHPIPNRLLNILLFIAKGIHEIYRRGKRVYEQ